MPTNVATAKKRKIKKHHEEGRIDRQDRGGQDSRKRKHR